ncbi:hypothetical protein [Tautonia plasticadhaerens]|uniref:Uncharacterized protein n=1 Tax=Tautonia plasticadhaerens TaxID=2527974 RepID=A0A518H458_9BACT|nr:hypothetical protein [Tautonia plasticadhaerens]QDV35640.1 hypothetical protein ElP_35440 [Tautonia plasticadhaerens]
MDLDAEEFTPAHEADGFMDFLGDRLFPGLYWEPSTRGHGRHGLVWVLKRGLLARQVRNAFDHLDAQVKRAFAEWRATNPDTTLRGVEIKGHPPVERYLGDTIADIQLGQLRKVFRPSIDRLDEYMASTAMTVPEIMALDYQPQVILEGVEQGSISDLPVNASTKWHPLPQRLLDALEPIARWLHEQGWENLKAGPFVANLRDAASSLMTVYWCSGDMNEDGTMPTARLRSIMDGAKEAGDFVRGYNGHRAKAIRGWLEARGMLHMVDRRYWATVRDDQGDVTTRGQAAKWHLTAKEYAAISTLVGGAGPVEEVVPAATTVLRRPAAPADGVSQEGPEEMSSGDVLNTGEAGRESTFGDTSLDQDGDEGRESTFGDTAIMGSPVQDREPGRDRSLGDPAGIESLDLDDETLPERPELLMQLRLACVVGLIPCPPHLRAGPIAA